MVNENQNKFIESEVIVVSESYAKEWEVKKQLVSSSNSKLGQVEKKITLSAVIICKNEQDNIVDCIENIEQFGFDEIIIIDTGSSDLTKTLVQKCISNFKNVKLYDFMWCDDFSAARNFGIDIAKSDWIFFIDCDERFKEQNRRSIKEMINFYAEICGNIIGICPVIISSKLDKLYNNPRLFCKKAGYRYYGNVHEMLRKNKNNYETVPFICLNIQMEHSGYLKEKMEAKLNRNFGLLDINILKEPDNPLWLCYKLRDGREFLNNEEKNKIFQTIERICKPHLDDSFYIFCFDWASILFILDLIKSHKISQAKGILYDLVENGRCCDADIFYLNTFIELESMDLRLNQMEGQCKDVKMRAEIATSLINTYGYHIDEVYMRILEKQHKMGEFIKYKDFLFTMGYLAEQKI